jgi:hypothetical protein
MIFPYSLGKSLFLSYARDLWNYHNIFLLKKEAGTKDKKHHFLTGEKWCFFDN